MGIFLSVGSIHVKCLSLQKDADDDKTVKPRARRPKAQFPGFSSQGGEDDF